MNNALKFSLAGFTIETSEQAATIWHIVMMDPAKAYLIPQCRSVWEKLKAAGK